MKVAEIGAEMGKRVGRSVGESVSSRSTSGNPRLGSPRAPIYRRRGLQRQIISAELSRPSPPPNTNSIITRLNEPKRAKNKRGRWRKWRRRSSYLHTPSVTVRCWICLMALRIAHFSVAQGLKSIVRLNCDWKGKSESQILISHNLDVGVFIQLVIISVISVQEGRRC